MTYSQIYCLTLANSLIFFLCLCFGVQSISHAKYAILIIPALLSLAIFLFIRKGGAAIPRFVILLLFALPLEYAFLLRFYVSDTLWTVAYLVGIEFFHIWIFMLVLRYSDDAEWRCRLAHVYFIPAACNLFFWVGPMRIFQPLIMPIFAPEWLSLVFSMYQLTVYDFIRPRVQRQKDDSRTTIERAVAWFAYCVSGYREPAREEKPKERGGPQNVSKK